MAAAEKTLPGEFGKGAFWGAFVAAGLALVSAVFSPQLAAGIFVWGLGGGTIAATLYGINKLTQSLFPKKEAA
jgi:hypothetical protein